MICPFCDANEAEPDDYCEICGEDCCSRCSRMGCCPCCEVESLGDEFRIKELDFNDDPYDPYPFDPYPDEKLIDEIRAGLRK